MGELGDNHVFVGAVSLVLEVIGEHHLPRIPLDRVRVLRQRRPVVVQIAVVELCPGGWSNAEQYRHHRRHDAAEP
jgi:hypothetical protein